MLNHQFCRGSHRINMWAKIFLLAVTVNLIYCEERIIYKYKPIYTEHGSNEKYILKSPYRQVYREPAPTHEEEEQSVFKNHGLQNLNYFRPEEANSGESHIEYQHHPVSYRQYYQGHEHVHQEDQNKYVAHYPVHHSEPETKIKYYIPNHIEHENHANKYHVPHIPVHHVEPESDIKYHHVPVNHHIESEHLAHHNAESHDEPIDYYAYPKYQYEYKIEDPHTGDNKFHHEYRDGDTVKGVYSLVEPDGSIRTVEYSSDKHHGFNAVVKHSAPSHNVQVESNHEV